VTEQKRSQGTPAPFTHDQVEAVVRGQADEIEIARLLESHRNPRVSLRRRRTEKAAPVAVSEKALAELSGGRTPPGLVRQLDAAAKRDKQPPPETETIHERPSQQPPPAVTRRKRH
jgi:hypothetical protein